ncbi:MAG: peptidase prolyl oligopeptidase active site domain protein [Bryobacterales bacterium]|nr:peptidase prolyl oligopeptidase active site domain protein [Bryobacterales bacterium]
MRVLGFLLACSSLFAVTPPARRLLNIDDLYRLKQVGDPQVSPDGKLVAYTVTVMDKESDKQITNIWMADWDGSGEFQLTYDNESASSPHWSPDGKYLAFMSSRPGKTKGAQVWILDRRGGEARQFTHLKDQTITQFEWSPDSTRLALVLRDKEDPATAAPAPDAEKRPKPIVIDRYHFKEDQQGYLPAALHNHLYLLDPATEKLEQITAGDHDEHDIAWAPDGSEIAFVSNHDRDPDRTLNSDVFIMEAHPGAKAQQLTTFKGPDSGPLAWSPDSKLIAYLQGSEPKYSAYSMERLAVVPAAGGTPRILSSELDRGVFGPKFTADGAILMRVVDDRSEYVAQVSLNGGSPDRIVPGKLVVSAFSTRAGHIAVSSASDNNPNEIYALEGGSLRKLSSQNDKLVTELMLGNVEDISFKSKDGTEVHGLLTLPPAFDRSKKYPTLLRIHGGPNGQDDHQFEYGNQIFAANDYVVINVDYRGSSGRGEKYGQSIFADWGNKEVADLLAGVDHVVQMGIADPDRLGIGGWSYGGILTDYSIASTNRFKAAISGAGSALQLSMYGIDQYVFQYDNELGPPWKNPDAWMKVSYPFFKADRIHTPTLFMGGDKDFNVPLAGGEQMYEALRSLGIPTELVVYPGEFHGFRRPSFLADRYTRYLAWYDKYLNPANSNQPVLRTLR